MASAYETSVGNSCCCTGISTCFTQQLIAIDGSKFKAVNNHDRDFTKAKVRTRLQQIEESIERYLSMLDTADRTEPAEFPAKAHRFKGIT
jgi:hypothetical protein